MMEIKATKANSEQSLISDKYTLMELREFRF